MTWKIVSDSGADIQSISDLSPTIQYERVPLILNIDNHIFTDDHTLKIGQIMDRMEATKIAATSACPGPDAYAKAYEGADNILCFTLSANISGSYNSAVLAKEMVLEKNPHANIYIFNTHSAGAEIDLLIYQAIDLIQQDLDFETVISKLEAFHRSTHTNFLLESVDSLVKNGRISKIIGQMIGLLGIRLIGKRSPEGTIELAQKAKGTRRAMKAMLEEMKHNHFDGLELVISHVLNPDGCQDFANLVRQHYPQVKVTTLACSGLCSFYAQRHGLIIAYSGK